MSARWPNLTYLYASTNNMDENGKTEDLMTGYDNVFDPSEQYAAYKFYLQPREEFVIETDPNVHSRSMFKEADEDRSTEYNDGDSFRRGSTCRVLLCICLIITLIAVVISAVVLAVLLTSETRRDPIVDSPTSYESSIRLKNKTFTKELEMKNSTEFQKLEAELCLAMETMMKAKGSPIENSFENCEVVEFMNGSVVARFKLNLKGKPSTELKLGELLREFIKKKIDDPGPWQMMGWDEQSIQEFVTAKRPERTFVSKTETAITSSMKLMSSVHVQIDLSATSSIIDILPSTSGVSPSQIHETEKIESWSQTLLSDTGISGIVETVLSSATDMPSVRESALISVQSKLRTTGLSELVLPSLLPASDIFSIGELESSVISDSEINSISGIVSSSVVYASDILESESVKHVSVMDTVPLFSSVSNVLSVQETSSVSMLPESLSSTTLIYQSTSERRQSSLMMSSETDSLLVSPSLVSYASSSDIRQSAATSALITDSHIQGSVFSSSISPIVSNDRVFSSDISVLVLSHETTPILTISPVSVLGQSFSSVTDTSILKSMTLSISIGSDVASTDLMSSAVRVVIKSGDYLATDNVLLSQVKEESLMTSSINETLNYSTIAESNDISLVSSLNLTLSIVSEFDTASVIDTLESQVVIETQIPLVTHVESSHDSIVPSLTTNADYVQATSLAAFPASASKTIAPSVLTTKVDITSGMDVTSNLLISSEIQPDSKSIELAISTTTTSDLYHDSSIVGPETRDPTAIRNASGDISTSYTLKNIPIEDLPSTSGIESSRVHVSLLGESSFVYNVDLFTSSYVISDISFSEQITPTFVKPSVSSEQTVSPEIMLETTPLDAMGSSIRITSSELKDQTDKTRQLFTFDFDGSKSSVFAIDSIQHSVSLGTKENSTDNLNSTVTTSIFQSGVTSNIQQSQQLSSNEQTESSYALSVSSKRMSSVVYNSLSNERRISSSIFSKSFSGDLDTYTHRLSTERLISTPDSLVSSSSTSLPYESRSPISSTVQSTHMEETTSILDTDTTEFDFSIKSTSPMFTSSYFGKSADSSASSFGNTFSSVTGTSMEPIHVSMTLENTSMTTTSTPVISFTTTELERLTTVARVSRVTDSDTLFITADSVSPISLLANTSEPVLEVTVSVTSSTLEIQPTSILSIVPSLVNVFTSGTTSSATAISDDTNQIYNVTTDSEQENTTTGVIFENVNISTSSVDDTSGTVEIKSSIVTLPSVILTKDTVNSVSLLLTATPQLVDKVSSSDIFTDVEITPVVSKPAFTLPSGLKPSNDEAAIDRMLFNIDEIFN